RGEGRGQEHGMTSGPHLHPQLGSPADGAAGAVMPPLPVAAVRQQPVDLPPRRSGSRPAPGRRQAGLQGRVISYAEFISAVQEVGALATAGEAERAATAVLSELAGCLSW